MLKILGPRDPSRRLCDGVARREFLRVGALGGFGLTLPQLLGAQANGVSSRADSCIVIFLNGGPSHLDMWDMKPDAPSGIRSPFASLPTTVTGVRFCEYLPQLAKQMHRCTLVRSMNHSVNNSHAAAVYAALTGHDRGEQGGGAKPGDHPNIGSVLAKLRPVPRRLFPTSRCPTRRRKARAARSSQVSSAASSVRTMTRSGCSTTPARRTSACGTSPCPTMSRLRAWPDAASCSLTSNAPSKASRAAPASPTT